MGLELVPNRTGRQHFTLVGLVKDARDIAGGVEFDTQQAVFEQVRRCDERTGSRRRRSAFHG